ncbi:ASKHA domain-containing protein [Paraclostridium ghonii]|uniref:ASKHA domain-containing protein n=1 Tax=Paraclostridium ghonii TaxID=29358 RepID=UPI00202CABE0|nr:ASKHA domain-containing protein [Paeniclostridium ghonii]MCM0167428.1 ASKHA domain-containing protein [Paeniclostridium ghonii]
MSLLYDGDKYYKFEVGRNLLDIIQSNNLGMESPCGGKGLCGKCKIKVLNGDVNSLTNEELKFLSKEDIDNNIRLGCLVYPKGDILVEFLDKKDANHKILVDGYMPNFEKTPILTKVVHKIEKPTLQNNLSYEEIFGKCFKYDFKEDYKLLKELPNLVEYEKCTGVYMDEKLIGLEANDTCDKLYSVAIDIGTTTVVCSLIDIKSQCELSCESEVNPQKEYGLDVLSRIHFIKNKKNGLEVLNKLIIDCINNLIIKLCENNSINRKDIYEVSIAANTTMMHILLNINPISIGKSPYSPIFIKSKNISSKDLGIKISNFGSVYLLPGVSSYIGADIVAGVCVCDLKEADKNVLFIDIGTNGEMVLSKKGELVSCSCAAGPALEGMNISCGMRAGDGAIENIKIEDKININTIGDKDPIGICGSGIVDAISELARLKLIGKTGRIVKKETIKDDEKLSYLSECIVDENKKRRFIISKLDNEISITQEDIRQVQLAKGAILSGIYALADKVSMDINELDEVIIAGQFGKHLSVESLVGVGIIPKELKEKITYIGNSSKTGAIMSLLSRDIRKSMDFIANDINYFELSTKEGYERLFTDCLKF